MRTCKKGHTYPAVRDQFNRLKGCPTCIKATAVSFHQNRKQAADFLQKHKETQAKWYKKHGSPEEQRMAQRANRLKTRYWPHLTMWEALAEYERILALQDSKCRICEVHQEEYDAPFHVDHCHTTGAVRGLLCMVCNRYIVGGIDIRTKAKKVRINKRTIVDNIIKYFKELDPEYRQLEIKLPKTAGG